MFQVQSRSTFMEGADILTWHGAKSGIKVKPAPTRAKAAFSATDVWFFFRARCTNLEMFFTNWNQNVFFHCLAAARPATTLFSRSRTRMERGTGVPAAAAAAVRCRCPNRAPLRTPGVGLDPTPVPGTVPTSGPGSNLHVGAATLR